MMVEIERWTAELTQRLLERFGGRLLFLGLQGSYGRGEAGPDSDIDMVTVLDRVELADLDAYRAIVSAMTEGEKACGFVCGRAELEAWPKFDLLQLAQDTRSIYGTLDGLLPPFGMDDLVHGISIGASALYHAVCHTYLYAPREEWPAFLKQAHKNAFFLMRILCELRAGERVRTRRELLHTRISDDEREILEYGWTPASELDGPEAVFSRLMRWSSSAMEEARLAKSANIS